MSEEQKDVTGIVTAFFESEGANKPHKVYIRGEDGAFSTFDDATVEAVEDGIEVAFTAEKNGEYWNITDGSVEVVDTDPDVQEGASGASIRNSEGIQSGDGEVFESPRARSIRCNVALKQARELCQPMLTEDVSEARFEEIRATVLETADVFAEKLRELNQQTGGDA